MSTDPDGTPQRWRELSSSEADAIRRPFSERGIGLRDYFAGEALGPTLAALAANPDVPDEVLNDLFGKHATNIRREQVAAALAYKIADAMLARREQQ